MSEEAKAVKKYEIIAASPKALEACDASLIGKNAIGVYERDADEQNAKYPFKSLLVGESFAIPFGETNPGTLASLRSSATTYGKRLSRRFRVFSHNEYSCIEVARIA